MSSASLDHALWALQQYDLMAMSTVGSDGSPHVAGVFFAPRRSATGIELLIALVEGSAAQRDVAADPRVAFICSPGNPSRWIQGTGIALQSGSAEPGHELLRHLIAHAPGARAFTEGFTMHPVIVVVRTLKIVEGLGARPSVLELPA